MQVQKLIIHWDRTVWTFNWFYRFQNVIWIGRDSFRMNKRPVHWTKLPLPLPQHIYFFLLSSNSFNFKRKEKERRILILQTNTNTISNPSLFYFVLSDLSRCCGCVVDPDHCWLRNKCKMMMMCFPFAPFFLIFYVTSSNLYLYIIIAIIMSCSALLNDHITSVNHRLLQTTKATAKAK